MGKRVLIAAVLLVGLGLLAALVLRPERASDPDFGPSVGVPSEAPVPAPPDPDAETPVAHAAREEEPYARWDTASLLARVAMTSGADLKPDPQLRSLDSLKAEARALMHELRKLDLTAEPHHTDGWSGFSDAEWPMMALAYTGFALCNLAEVDPSFKATAKRDTAFLLDALRSRTISGFMEPHFGPPFPPEGEIERAAVFLHGHYLYLAARCRKLFGPAELDELTARVARALVRDYSSMVLLDSYRGMTYVSDNLPALAGLKRYDSAFGEQGSEQAITRAVRELRAKHLHPGTGLLGTYLNRSSGRIMGEPRGIGVAYALAFLPEVEGEFAKEQWACARKWLVRELPQIIEPHASLIPGIETLLPYCGGLYVCREHPEVAGASEADLNWGDLDSGPLVLGVSPSASAYLIAAAHQAGEHEVARGAENLAMAVGSPERDQDRLYYRAMFHPVGQAITLYGKTLGIGK